MLRDVDDVAVFGDYPGPKGRGQAGTRHVAKVVDAGMMSARLMATCPAGILREGRLSR